MTESEDTELSLLLSRLTARGMGTTFVGRDMLKAASFLRQYHECLKDLVVEIDDMGGWHPGGFNEVFARARRRVMESEKSV